MIEPFFFGPRKAFACYQSARDSSSAELLVICPPLFDEYRRCYRAIADLANACSDKGKHVIRLDYSGTGESQGELSEFTANDWIDDIYSVIEEGIALTGAQSVVLVGVRFGAALAVHCKHAAITRFVLWDPILSGQEYLGWLSSVNKKIESGHRWLARQVGMKSEVLSFENFTLGESLERSISELKLVEIDDIGDRINVVTTDKSVAENGPYINCQFSGLEYDWPSFHEGNFHPKSVLTSIALMVLEK
jgi:alpha-beta hydrolase superfamily lysophospholipase